LYDKVLTSEVLINGEIPNVEHLLILKEDWRKYLQIEKTAKEEVIDILSKISLPVVVKLNNGSQGNGVYLCESEREVQNMVEVLKNKQSLAISKYYNCEFEYRFYILDGEILFAYKKIKTNGWRHNLSLGAKAELIDERFEKYTNLKELSLKTFNCLGIRCGAIDILDTSEGLKVLEVNNGIMMDGFASTCPEYFEIAKQAHKKMLSASFKKIL
jgi:ribosomal protein S6--L-glutamate ligase